MDAEIEQYVVRVEYAHALAEVRQHFAGALLTLEPDALARALERLIAEMPDPRSRAEVVMGSASLGETIVIGATRHHALFHAWFDDSPCAFRWDDIPSYSTHPAAQFAVSLRGWSSEYVRRFDEQHAWPAAVRAAILLRQSSQRTWYVEELARAVNVSAATLERGFRKVYGVSAQRYQCLARLRSTAQAIRAEQAAVEGVLLDLGWRSMKDAYRPFRRMTGMTIGAIRNVTDSEFGSLIDGVLALPLPIPFRRRQPVAGIDPQLAELHVRNVRA